MARIDDEIKSRFSDDKHRLGVNIVFTANWIQNHFTELLRPFGISHQQYNILRILRGANDWLPMAEIKSRMVEKSPNATRMADKLLAKGLVERRRSDSDRRVVYLQVTKEGLALMQEIDSIESDVLLALDQNLSNEEAKLASDVLDKLRG